MLGVHTDLRGQGLAGKHRIVSQLGQGGTADVYLAVADGPSGFHKLVVLKVLKQSLGSDHEFRDMFLREARLAARLCHPNIVQTYEVLEVEGTPIIVMEYLEGQPLTQVIVRGRQAPHRFTLAMQLRVLVDALGGLHAAHELTDFDGAPLGVVHRDVSPHNLFVTVEGQAKVLDFGIAKLGRAIGEGEGEGEVMTEVGTIKGKLRYMAPEQLAGETLDRRADIYAAGVILWEALAGERMWKGCSEQQIRSRVQAGDLPSPVAGRPAAPGALDRICRRALSLSVEDRHATALELADEIEEALSTLGLVASRREIGATVVGLFEDVRAETREAIERIVAPASAGAGVSVGDLARGVPHTEASRTLSASARPRPPRRRPGAFTLAAAATALLILVALGVWRGDAVFGRRAPIVSAPSSFPAPIAAPAPFGPRVVHRVDPVLATFAVTSQGAAQPANDVATSTRRAWRESNGPGHRSSARHALNAPGAPGELVEINVPIVVGAPTVAGAPAATTPAATSAAPSSGGAANVARDCDQPFFVDVDGIKKFRPECL